MPLKNLSSISLHCETNWITPILPPSLPLGSQPLPFSVLPTLVLGPVPQSSVLSPAPMLFIQPRVPEDSDTSSGSDYEHYDFSSQPPVALTTFYSECWAGSRGLGPAGGHLLVPTRLSQDFLVAPLY